MDGDALVVAVIDAIGINQHLGVHQVAIHVKVKGIAAEFVLAELLQLDSLH